MGVFGYPLFHLDAQPKGIDATGDDGEQEPFDIIAEKLSAGTVKGELASVDDGVFCNPGLLQANSPRSSNAKVTVMSSYGKRGIPINPNRPPINLAPTMIIPNISKRQNKQF